MVGAVHVFDDLNDGALRALAATPFTLGRYFTYHTTTVAACSFAGLLVAVRLSGLAPMDQLRRLLPALALAPAAPDGDAGPLVVATNNAVATNNIEGLTALKALGLSVMAPSAPAA